MIFIAYNYNGKVIGIVNARSRQLAVAFWQGRDVIPHTIKAVEDKADFIPLDEHITGVYPLLETREIEEYIHGKFKKFVCVI